MLNPPRYILEDKVRKELCRVPALLNRGRVDLAGRLLDKHRHPRSPVILGFDVAAAETRGQAAQAARLYRARGSVLRYAARNGPAEIGSFFTYLFAFYVGRRKLTRAMAVFRAGRAYGLAVDDYGMLWVRCCDAAGRIAEGEAAARRILGGRRLSASERRFLDEHYPNLAAHGVFDRLTRSSNG